MYCERCSHFSAVKFELLAKHDIAMYYLFIGAVTPVNNVSII